MWDTIVVTRDVDFLLIAFYCNEKFNIKVVFHIDLLYIDENIIIFDSIGFYFFGC
jgi:hypothetical protein